jgi:hypothetical protein
MGSVAEAVRNEGPSSRGVRSDVPSSSGRWMGRGRAALQEAPAAAMWAAGAEATASPPEATGCLEETDRTGAGGAAGPSELLSADPAVFFYLFV